MQIPLLRGVYVDSSPDFRVAYPRNYVPTPTDQGISKGYLRPADGLVEFASGAAGAMRGSINWNGSLYAVMGSRLVRVSSAGVITDLGSVAGTGLVTMDYSFDRLGIASGGALYYFDGGSVSRVTDPDMGNVIDTVWVDGYWMTTDGSFLVVTDLTDPYAVNPLKYGSSEADPDPIVALRKLRNEVHAINRYTTEVFDNIGGDLFPFQRLPSAIIECGAIGTHTACLYGGNIAVLGSARGEPPSIYLIGGGERQALATAEIDRILSGYSEAVLAGCLLESRMYDRHEQLMLHLPDRTLVYDIAVSKDLGEPVWFELCSSVDGAAQYRAQLWTWCYDRWLFGDPQAARIGYADRSRSDHYGAMVGWMLSTTLLYNSSRSAIVHEIELVALPGRVPLGADPVIWTCYTKDGETWSQERMIGAGRQGQRDKRLVWRQQGTLQNYRGQRFRGLSDCHLPVARLEMQLEALSV